MVAEFKERQRTSVAQHEAAAQAKHAEKAAAAAQTVSEAAATSAAAARVEAPADEDQRRSPRKEAERLAAVVAGSPFSAGQHDSGTRRSAQVWAAFDTTTGAPCVRVWPGVLQAIEAVNLAENGVCGASISIGVVSEVT